MIAYLKQMGVSNTANVDWPLLVNVQKEILTKSMFVSKVKDMVGHMGLNPDLYSGHSFRSGSASSGTERGHFQRF